MFFHQWRTEEAISLCAINYTLRFVLVLVENASLNNSEGDNIFSALYFKHNFMLFN